MSLTCKISHNSCLCVLVCGGTDVQKCALSWLYLQFELSFVLVSAYYLLVFC